MCGHGYIVFHFLKATQVSIPRTNFKRFSKITKFQEIACTSEYYELLKVPFMRFSFHL